MAAAADRGMVVPLPEYHRRGLIVLTVFSFLSFLSTTLLWLFITYKLLTYQKQRRAQKRREEQQQSLAMNETPDLSLGLDAPCSRATGFARILELDRLAAEQAEQRAAAAATARESEIEEEKSRNPFPILVYNLLLADMMEAVAYSLSLYWISVDGIYAPSSVCWAQGWLGSTSNLAASLFLSTISINTFLTVGLGYKPPPWAIYTTIAGLWIFDFGINAAGVIASTIKPAVPGESFFMRANVCTTQSETAESGRVNIRQPEGPELSGYHPAFLVYPFVYVGCCIPLVVGRVTALVGVDLGISYFAFAGSILAANGLFNSILWTTTILFSAPQDVHDAGLDKFAFARTPIRNFGHMVFISGPTSRRVSRSEFSPSSNRKEWWWWKHGGQRGWGRSYASTHDMPVVHSVAVPTHTLPGLPGPVEGPYIQMDVITAVVNEPVDTDTITPVKNS
ncbi:hypothetical protein CCHL11_08642 [Colletotrichum chlorophyti]|uniref:Integral membrane protein n=1 Tax=Colletotrichum chlorophyti TaxID=708187 RepID=A0A1Q8RC66_9PEZI|nr:hypothetical protein CCHL11_08642 [Colletotrichum chlorophyti]